jgi:hypothetical protein
MLEGAVWGAIISLVLSLIFIPLFQDAVTDFLVRTLSNPFGLRKSETLTGVWEQNWQVDGYEPIVHENTELQLNQFGKSLVGKLWFQNRTYRIRARIENNTYISGIWFDEKTGQVYHGSFQARIEVNNSEVNGKWVGFSKSHNKINTGNWQWKKRA